MKRRVAEVAVAVIAIVAVASARADEKRINKSEVPNAVLEAVSAKYPNMEITGYEHEQEGGKTVYEINGKIGSQKADITVSAEGKILSEELTISIADLPDAVKTGFAASNFGKAKVKKIEKVTDFEKSESKYELVVKHGKEANELVFSKGGELTKQEAVKEEDKD